MLPLLPRLLFAAMFPLSRPCHLTLAICGAVMSITVAIMSMAFERLWVVIPGNPYFDSLQSLGFTSLIMLVGGIIAFFMVWTEFAVIANTSALTFMIAGTFKELVTGVPVPLMSFCASHKQPTGKLEMSGHQKVSLAGKMALRLGGVTSLCCSSLACVAKALPLWPCISEVSKSIAVLNMQLKLCSMLLFLSVQCSRR